MADAKVHSLHLVAWSILHLFFFALAINHLQTSKDAWEWPQANGARLIEEFFKNPAPLFLLFKAGYELTEIILNLLIIYSSLGFLRDTLFPLLILI